MTDDQLDLEMQRFLSSEGERVRPVRTSAEMAARIAERSRPVGLSSFLALPSYQRQLATAVLLALLLALFIGSAVYFGSRQDRPPDRAIVDSTPTATDTPLPLATGAIPASPAATRLPTAVENGWIAFSTEPASGQPTDNAFGLGSDIYLGREGVDPSVIVTRGSARLYNICPTFSADGLKLAYGEADAERNPRAIVILDVAEDGSVSPRARLTATDGSAAPCPRWSADGQRVAYMDGEQLVVTSLDGSRHAPRAGDPGEDQFVPHGEDAGIVISPSGLLTAEVTGSRAVFAAVDGSFERTLRLDNLRWMAANGYPPEAPYALAGWSPDSAKVLLMYDVSGGSFTMRALAVEEPFTSEAVAEWIPVNNARSWPAIDDVSWQAIYK
jgi:hypothetical protein